VFNKLFIQIQFALVWMSAKRGQVPIHRDAGLKYVLTSGSAEGGR